MHKERAKWLEITAIQQYISKQNEKKKKTYFHHSPVTIWINFVLLHSQTEPIASNYTLINKLYGPETEKKEQNGYISTNPNCFEIEI